MWFLLFPLLAVATPWDDYNNPSVWSSSLQYNFASLPSKGQGSSVPWSDTYWPSYESGIAHRWNSNDPNDFKYDLNTKEQVAAMTLDQLGQLSPAEKLDIFNDRYDYPLVHSEWQRTSAEDPSWEGLCHGWSPASIHYKQPNPVNVKSPAGVTVPFGSSDVKALLTYYCAQYDTQAATLFIAERCNIDLDQHPESADTPACIDINAGAYQVVAANMLGNSSGFVIDRTRSIQVWNQPVYSFETTVLNQNSTTVNVSVSTTYSVETGPEWESHEAATRTETYQYTLDLDESGAITGGDHITWDRPDFAWITTPTSMHGYFANLKTIYDQSTNNTQSERETIKPALGKKPTYLRQPTGTFSLGPYPSNHLASWVIQPLNAKEITITFEKFDVERVFDSVRILEGSDGNGAPVAVLYGQGPKTVVVKASSASVIFKSNFGVSGQGFTAHYKVH